MTKKRFGTMAACLALVGAVAVGGTLALLSSQSNDVVNTFSVSNGYDDDDETKDFILREHDADQDSSGNYVAGEDAELVTKNEYTNLVKNTTLDKDPFFILQNGGAAQEGETPTTPPDSWVVAELDLAEIKALAAEKITFIGECGAGDADEGNVNNEKEWFLVTGNSEDGYSAATEVTADVLNGIEGKEGKVYLVYNSVVKSGEKTTPIFTQLSVSDEFDEEMTTLNLTIKGVAVQAMPNSTLTENLDEIMAEVMDTLYPTQG